MVIQQWSKQSFQRHHPGVSETPRLDFFFLQIYWENGSAGDSTSLSLEPAARNSLELITIATGGRDVSTSGVHSWNVSPDESSSTLC